MTPPARKAAPISGQSAPPPLQPSRHAAAPNRAAPKISLRRSMRSESHPNGYCSTSAPANSMATNSAIRSAPSPIWLPNTAPMPDWVA